ncbi:hypothetical protein BTJ68_02495 [Hortaea werneckii EXF-2000]|uniref:Polyketide synthase phosphopantetheine-binding domain-containing protein n=2 Tax=Hortaea werneckii TaxID=91943 RepID=A0A3M7IEA9_HORWE|nr:hypothetical protein BTJ68_02495 [Hortaea werneckii EXF-2000]RMZ23693.1 hypothetical protein D0859_12265 [Hortaea werneckii]
MATMISTATIEARSRSVVFRPVDHSLNPEPEKFHTTDGLLRSHASEPDQPPLVCYPAKGVADFEEWSARDLNKFTNAAVARYRESGLEPASPDLEKAPVVAILAPSSLDIVVTFFALNRLGYAALFLSTRLTAPAYSRLLDMANCSSIITTESFSQTIEEIQQERQLQHLSLVGGADYRNQDALPFRRHCDPVRESHKIGWILHSSGSTGFPKPIYLTNYQCLANFRKSFSMKCFCVSPLFHSQALMELGRSFYTRKAMYIGNFSFPVTRQNLVAALKVAQPEQITTVPYVLKLLAESDDGIAELAKAKLVLYGGSACPDDLGDRLVAQGVNLVGNYGATETGQIMTSFRPPGDKEWSYMRVWPPVADYSLFDEIAPGVFECVALDGLPSKGPSNSDDPPKSFRTADLFTRHPDPKKSNYYKYLSRLDDRLTLVNGEKVLPIPIEGRIREDELVKEAIVFGFQKTVPGAIIFKADRAAHMSDAEFLEAVWPAVEAANMRAESFSRIPKELVIIKDASIAYPKTDKGTFIRAQMYQQFAEDIERVYHGFEKGQAEGTLQLDPHQLEEFLLEKFRNDLRVPLPNAETDVFSAGVDSLQTTRMWRIIKKHLDLGGHDLSNNVVFEKGNVRALARYLYELRTGDGAQKHEDEIEVMRNMIEKYSSFTQHFPTQSKQPEKEVVLVTGGTGNLGAWLIADLLKRPSVAEVWALVRAPGQAAAGARIMQSLVSRKINLTDAEAAKLFAVPSDFSKPDLGLQAHELNHLLSSTTCIIHSAWAVNFNLGVRSFENQHVRGVHNLINFCLRVTLPSPAKFFFCSSVSTASGTPKPASIPEAAIEDLTHAQGTGYGRSKLVAEHIVRNAMRQGKAAGLHARVLRIGQLSGDCQNADWNPTEAIALMIRSALTTKSLPALDERPSWLPVDLCAGAILDIAFPKTSQDPREGRVGASTDGLSEDAELVYHLVNPKLFSWKEGLLPALKRTNLPAFDVVSPGQWLDRLRKSDADPVRNPSVKLIGFWEKKYGSGARSTKAAVTEEASQEDSDAPGLTFETSKTAQASHTIAGAVDPVSAGLVERYVEAWLRRWVE